MAPYLTYSLFALIAYLVGGFPTGVVLSRQKYGIDVREMGSGNIGATNVTRVFGWYAGVLTFAIDFLKGLFPILAVQYYFPESTWLAVVAGIFLVLGHCFSPYLKFRGGKGVATSLGCISVVAPWGALVAAVTYLILLLLTKISAVGSLGGIFVIFIYVWFAHPPFPIQVMILGISAIVVVQHHSNIRRLLDGFKNRKAKGA